MSDTVLTVEQRAIQMWRTFGTMCVCTIIVAISYPSGNFTSINPAPLDNVDYETNKLRSQWYWFESEIKDAKSFPDRNIYKSMQADVEMQLREDASICPVKSLRNGTYWTVCK